MKYIIGLFLVLNCYAATISWQDTNNPVGLSFIISNKLNSGSWSMLTNTISKTNQVQLSPGTNWFSITASNGLISDPSIMSSNLPFRVFNVIIEAKNSLQGQWMKETNMTQYLVTTAPMNFYRISAEIK